MKKMMTLFSLLISMSSFSASIYPSSMALLGDAMTHCPNCMPIFTTINGLTSSTTAANPIAGLVAFADNGEIMLDMESEALQDELAVIEMALEEGEELTDLQKAIIEIGSMNNQL